MSNLIANILLCCFCLVVISWALCGFGVFVTDRHRDKREQEEHEKKMMNK